jgi:hypothetical protein
MARARTNIKKNERVELNRTYLKNKQPENEAAKKRYKDANKAFKSLKKLIDHLKWESQNIITIFGQQTSQNRSPNNGPGKKRFRRRLNI